MTRLATVLILCLLTAAPAARAVTPIRDPGGKALEQLHRALKRTARGVGQTRILQFGASHTEADLFTGYLRQFMQARFGDAGHGYIMPVQPWRGYRHQDVRISSSEGWLTEKAYAKTSRKDGLYGLAGFAVASASPQDFGWVGTSTRSPFGAKVGRFEIFYLRQPGGGSFDVAVDGEHYMRVRSHGTLGLGVRSVRVQDGPHELEVRPAGDGEVRLLGVVMERGAPGVVVDTLGIRGARASVMLQWDEALWQAQIRRRNPDLVVLAYGTNEAGDRHQPIETYEARLTQVLGRLKIAVPQASCVLFGPTDRPRKRRGRLHHRPRTDQVIAVQRKLSARFGCGFWDAVEAMGGRMSIVQWARHDPPLARTDYVHLTARGYQALADDFANALLRGFGP